MSRKGKTSQAKPDIRKQGRPRKGKAPFVSWQEVDRLLVFGEKVVDEASGHEDIQYPSFRQVAERFGVSKSLIGQYAAKHNCMKRREENQAREQIQFEQELVKKRAKARALSTEDELRIIDDYIRGFEKAVEEGSVRYDNLADFNTMVRLKEFKLGRADSRQEVHGLISLEEIQARHKALQARLYGHDPALAGRRDGNRPTASDVAPEASGDGVPVDGAEECVSLAEEGEDSGANEQPTPDVVSFRDDSKAEARREGQGGT